MESSILLYRHEILFRTVADVTLISIRKFFEGYTGRNTGKWIAIFLFINSEAIAALIAAYRSVKMHLFALASHRFAFGIQLPEVQLAQFDQQRRYHFLFYTFRVSLIGNIV